MVLVGAEAVVENGGVINKVTNNISKFGIIISNAYL